jgi:hypothetical protein
MQANPRTAIEATLMVATVKPLLRLPTARISTLAMKTLTVDSAILERCLNLQKLPQAAAALRPQAKTQARKDTKRHAPVQISPQR